MIIFLLTFLAIYSGMHAVVVLRLWPLLPLALSLRCLLWGFLLLMILSPILIHLLDESGSHFAASILAWIGFTWMGFVFVAFCLGLVFYCLEGIILIVQSLFSITDRALLSPLSKAWLLLGITVAVLGIGFLQANDIRIKEIHIASPKLVGMEKGITLVQISDLHLGLLAGEKRVQTISELIQDIQPDILVCTGDLIDSNPQGLAELSQQLQAFHASWGKLAVTGNHETYVGLDAASDFLRRSGFVFLDGQVWRKDGIALAGVAYSRGQECDVEREVVDRFKAQDFNVLLKHSPRVCPDSAAVFDLQLSGHTHKGQIFPFSLVTKIVYPYLAGMYRLDNGSAIYVNQGTGTWGPQLRLLTAQEITVFRIDGTAKSRFSVISNKSLN
ncbi:MAG: metallophosphoesterase [Desulfovermiculus sp.]|nr:metallophosphoesterase [Desulfovermiculus sp.]